MNIWFFRTLGGFKSLGVLARGLQETGARPTGTPASATRGGTLPLQVLPPAFAFSVTSSGSPLFLLLLASSLPFWHRLKGTGSLWKVVIQRQILNAEPQSIPSTCCASAALSSPTPGSHIQPVCRLRLLQTALQLTS